MSEPLLQSLDLRKSYPMGTHRVEVLKGVSLSVDAGETVCIEGTSGSGKSTLLHMLGSLDRPDAGSVRFRGREVASLPESQRNWMRARDIGFVFQSFHLLPELDVLGNVLLAAQAAGRCGAAEREAARDLLAGLGLGERLTHHPRELSGGEQQRVALARALINRPALVLADEPTGNLDSQNGERVLEGLFRLVHERGAALVLVTHNPGLAGLCQRRLLLRDGLVADREG